MTKPAALTFRHITSNALQRAKLTTSYALLERGLFRTHGPTAVRHLRDDERRQLARLGRAFDLYYLVMVTARSEIVLATTTTASASGVPARHSCCQMSKVQASNHTSHGVAMHELSHAAL